MPNLLRFFVARLTDSYYTLLNCSNLYLALFNGSVMGIVLNQHQAIRPNK